MLSFWSEAPIGRALIRNSPASRRGDPMKRREFIALIGGAAAWPFSARAQQGQRMRRIGVLMNLAADDNEGQARLIAFVQTLSELGWKHTNNVQIEICWGAGDTAR